MDRVYVYQEGFLNLLTLLKYLIANKIKPFNIKEENYEASLLEEVVDLRLSLNKNILEEIKNKLGVNVLKILYYVYLSNDNNKELIMYYFYLNALKYPDTITLRRDLKCVREALKLEKYVGSEAHKLKGFVRFKELNNKVLYAKIKATNNCLEILANHFKRRLKEEYWIIHDEARHIMAIYDKKDYYIIDDNLLKMEDNKLSKDKYEDLWLTFFKTIAIKERENKTVQRNFMPKKYWENIIEVREEK